MTWVPAGSLTDSNKMKKQDYYAVLGVVKEASDDDIKKSYRKLAMKYHPDRNKDVGAEDKFKEINEAYEILGDTEKRRHYDQVGDSNFFGGPGFDQTDININDIFSQIFGSNMFRNAEASHRPQQTLYLINISLLDAYIGRVVKLENGATITIPKGVRSGTRIHENGRFYRIDIHPDHKFKRANDDLLVDIEINSIEAMLGITADLDHLDQTKLQFMIPPGIQQGQIVKLSGKGMRNPETDRYGDLLIRVNIIVPKDLSEADKDILRTMQQRRTNITI